MPGWIGQTVGKVRIDQEIAKGGMAEVYLGTHLTLDRQVAVKVMHNYVEADPDLQARFEREAKVVAGLRHPNIVQIFDYDTADGHPYIVMEYLKGPSLAAYLRELHKRNNRIPASQVARLLVTIATALDYAHEQGVIHRDIKPGNIILHSKGGKIAIDKSLTEQTEPVLTDFGLVRIAQATTQTASGAVSGTPAYMSPEQAQGAKVDHRTDIYSLGVVLYEMIAGRIPFEGDTSWTVIFKHINEPPPPIPGIQPAIQRVIDRALAKNPAIRYQTARALAADYMDAIGLVAEASTLRMSLPPVPIASRTSTPDVKADPTQLLPASISGTASRPSTPSWVRGASFAGFVILFLGLGWFLFSQFATRAAPTSTPALLQTLPGPTTHVEHTASAAPVPAANPVGLLRFQDGTAPADAVTVSTSSLPVPPQGSQYEVWLIHDDGEQRLSIGRLDFDSENQGRLNFVDSQGRNLLGLYSGLEITIEPDPDDNPNWSPNVASAARLPSSALIHVRHVLYSFGSTPEQIGFIRGLDTNTRLVSDLSTQLLSAFEAGNQVEVMLQAERMLNVIVGAQSEEHKDWNGDGTLDNPGDGYGLLVNGDNLGYIQGTFTHADLASTSPDATENMLIHGEHVKISATNVSDWTAQLRLQLIEILSNPAGPAPEAAIRQAVAMANQIRVGLDVDGNERIEPAPGEGGAITAYEHAYYMADIELLPAADPAPGDGDPTSTP